MAGLLGMGGVSGLLGQGYGLNPIEQQLMRNYAIKNALIGAGVGLMNPDPRLPPSIGASLGRAGAGGLNAFTQAEGNFLNQRSDAQNYARNEQLMQASTEEEAEKRNQRAARNQWFDTLPPQQQDFARANPDLAGRAAADQMFPGKPSYEFMHDKATGEIVAFDRNNPSSMQVVRKGGMPLAEAPTTRTIMQPDGSQVAVQWDPQKGTWVPLQAPQGGSAVRGIPKLTEQQSKDLVYYQRGKSAMALLDQNAGALTSYRDSAAGSIPLVGNALVSNEYQLAQQAGREFLASILRKDTGAAVTAQEVQLYGSMFLPQPGDTPDTLAQKKHSREVALEAIKSGLGAAQRALPEEQTQSDSSGAPIPPGVDPQVWEFMTPEEKALWQN